MDKDGRGSSHSHFPARKGKSQDPDHEVAFKKDVSTHHLWDSPTSAPQQMQQHAGTQQAAPQTQQTQSQQKRHIGWGGGARRRDEIPQL